MAPVRFVENDVVNLAQLLILGSIDIRAANVERSLLRIGKAIVSQRSVASHKVLLTNFASRCESKSEAKLRCRKVSGVWPEKIDRLKLKHCAIRPDVCSELSVLRVLRGSIRRTLCPQCPLWLIVLAAASKRRESLNPLPLQHGYNRINPKKRRPIMTSNGNGSNGHHSEHVPEHVPQPRAEWLARRKKENTTGNFSRCTTRARA